MSLKVHILLSSEPLARVQMTNSKIILLKKDSEPVTSPEVVNQKHGSKPTSPLVIRDDLEDALGDLLRRLNTMPTWTKEKINLYGAVETDESQRNFAKSLNDEALRFT